MPVQEQSVEQLVAAGAHALQQSRFADARRHLEAAAGSGRAGARVWMFLAFACRGLGDNAAEEQALDRLLELEPQAVLGLILKADCRVRAEDESLAVTLYRNALKAAEVGSAPLSQAEVVELRRAEAVLKQLDAKH